MPEHQAIYGLELGKLWKKNDMKKVSGWLNALVFLEQWRGPTAATSITKVCEISSGGPQQIVLKTFNLHQR